MPPRGRPRIYDNPTEAHEARLRRRRQRRTLQGPPDFVAYRPTPVGIPPPTDPRLGLRVSHHLPLPRSDPMVTSSTSYPDQLGINNNNDPSLDSVNWDGMDLLEQSVPETIIQEEETEVQDIMIGQNDMLSETDREFEDQLATLTQALHLDDTQYGK